MLAVTPYPTYYIFNLQQIYSDTGSMLQETCVYYKAKKLKSLVLNLRGITIQKGFLV